MRPSMKSRAWMSSMNWSSMRLGPVRHVTISESGFSSTNRSGETANNGPLVVKYSGAMTGSSVRYAYGSITSLGRDRSGGGLTCMELNHEMYSVLETWPKTGTLSVRTVYAKYGDGSLNQSKSWTGGPAGSTYESGSRFRL